MQRLWICSPAIAGGRLRTRSLNTAAPQMNDTNTDRPLHSACDTANPAAWIATIAAIPFSTCVGNPVGSPFLSQSTNQIPDRC